ncbi:hypothetical protein AXF42_Ash008790 [Apostasia shenzhenica]|uniref:SUN domain-containing protein n=1 Tax=Apostasia shenzhenica TaxID=1088818 RepID=A0A2I0ASH4_9ASPA|nr:hypothetical protein AXF42_Ash008790 [Apostasia shenzhenica]
MKSMSDSSLAAMDSSPGEASSSRRRQERLRANYLIWNGNDLSHAIRGETVLRSRDLIRLKKDILAPSISPRLKKSTHRLRRNRCQNALSILTKNLLLLAALLYVGQVIWRWNAELGRYPYSQFSALDYDGRISEVEHSLKGTVKMLQFQLEVLDKKIGSEISIVTRELTKQVEEKGGFREKQLHKLLARTDDVGKSLDDLRDKGILTRAELEKFWNELKTRFNLDGTDKIVDLDHIMVLAREFVEKEIEKHAADGLGRVDYALASGGARVISHSEPYVFGKGKGWLAVGKDKNKVHSNAHKMLEPSFSEPGQCFPLQGSSGFVEIRLRTGIIPEAVTVEHVSKSAAYDRSSAPKDCRISGWFEEHEADPSTKSETVKVLTEFSYDREKSNSQTFTIPMVDAGIINMVRLDFTSNHGSFLFTCIYRFRVHGYEPRSQADLRDRLWVSRLMLGWEASKHDI